MILLLLNPLLSQFPSMRTLLPLLMYGTCYASKSKGNPHCVIGIVTGENRGTESNSIGGSRHAFILLPYRQQHTHYHPTNHYHLGAYHTTPHNPQCYEQYSVVYLSLPSLEHHAHSRPFLPNISQRGHTPLKPRSLLVLMTISHLEEMPTTPRSTFSCGFFYG